MATERAIAVPVPRRALKIVIPHAFLIPRHAQTVRSDAA